MKGLLFAWGFRALGHSSMMAGASKAPTRPQVPETERAETRILDGKSSDCDRKAKHWSESTKYIYTFLNMFKQIDKCKLLKSLRVVDMGNGFCLCETLAFTRFTVCEKDLSKPTPFLLLVCCCTTNLPQKLVRTHALQCTPVSGISKL